MGIMTVMGMKQQDIQFALVHDKEVGNMMADMLGLSFYSKRGDVVLYIILIVVQSRCDAKQHCRVHVKLSLYISPRVNDFVSFSFFL